MAGAVNLEHLGVKSHESPPDVSGVDVAAVVAVITAVRPPDVHPDEPKLIVPDRAPRESGAGVHTHVAMLDVPALTEAGEFGRVSLRQHVGVFGIFGTDPRAVIWVPWGANCLLGDEKLSVDLLTNRVAAVVEDTLTFRVPLIECSCIESPELLRHRHAPRDDEGYIAVVGCVQRIGMQLDVLLFTIEATEEREGREVAAFEEVVPTGTDHHPSRRQDRVDEAHGSREAAIGTAARDCDERAVVDQPLVHVDILRITPILAFLGQRTPPEYGDWITFQSSLA